MSKPLTAVSPGDDEDIRLRVIRENYDLMLRWVRRGIKQARKTGRLHAESIDVLNSAIASFLNATDGDDFDQSQPLDEVWETLRRKHLNRKIDTWRHRPHNPGERLNIRPSDVSDAVAADAWLGEIGDKRLFEMDPKVVLNDLMEMLEQIDDPHIKELAELRMQGYKPKEIAEITGWTRGALARRTNELNRFLDWFAKDGEQE